MPGHLLRPEVHQHLIVLITEVLLTTDLLDRPPVLGDLRTEPLDLLELLAEFLPERLKQTLTSTHDQEVTQHGQDRDDPEKPADSEHEERGERNAQSRRHGVEHQLVDHVLELDDVLRDKRFLLASPVSRVPICRQPQLPTMAIAPPDTPHPPRSGVSPVAHPEPEHSPDSVNNHEAGRNHQQTRHARIIRAELVKEELDGVDLQHQEELGGSEPQKRPGCKSANHRKAHPRSSDQPS